MKTALSPVRPVDNRLIALQHDMAVLKLVHEYGHLRRSEVARGVWPKSSARYAAKSSQRVVSRLLKDGLLYERPNALGGRSLVLSNKGAFRLQEIDIEAQSGYDLSNVAGPQFFHRTIGSCYLLERAALGHTVSGEYAIYKGRGLIGRGELTERFGKIPDGLVTVRGSERGYEKTLTVADWIEVESSYKGRKDIESILAIAWKVGEFLDLGEKTVLDRVLFVYDSKQRHERTLRSMIRRYLAEHPIENSDEILSSIVFVRCHVDIPLVFRGYKEITALELMQTKDTESTEEE